MWDPRSRDARTSFLQAADDPGTAPADAPLVCLQLSASWLPLVVGSLMQLAQPAAWTTTDRALQADLLGRVTDLISLVGTAGECIAMQFRLTSSCGLQFSEDGGASWIDVTNWSTQFPVCVREDQAYVLMQDGALEPPIALWNEAGTDWLYSG